MDSNQNFLVRFIFHGPNETMELAPAYVAPKYIYIRCKLSHQRVLKNNYVVMEIFHQETHSSSSQSTTI